MVAPSTMFSSAAGLASAPLRAQAAGSPSGSFFNRSGFGANFADVASGIRTITRNAAAGFGQDPYTREAARQGLSEDAARQDETKRQILEMTYASFDKIDTLLAAHPQAYQAMQPQIQKSMDHARAAGVPEEFLQQATERFAMYQNLPAAQDDFTAKVSSLEAQLGRKLTPDELTQLGGARVAPEQATPSTVLGPIMAKIAATGIESLTAGERRAYEDSLPKGSTTTIDLGNKPLTIEQARALGYADRMANAENILGEVAGYTPSLGQDVVSGLPGGNLVTPENKQRFDAARLDFISAVLRKESGAVIDYSPNGEFDKENKKYFPQPGDGPKALADKEHRRALAIANMRREGRYITGNEGDGGSSGTSEQSTATSNAGDQGGGSAGDAELLTKPVDQMTEDERKRLDALLKSKGF